MSASNVPWYRSGAVPESSAYVDEIRAPKRQKIEQSDSDDHIAAAREADFSKPFVVPTLATGAAKYLVPTVDGYAVDRASAEAGDRFKAEWVNAVPTDAKDLRIYNRFVENATSKETDTARIQKAFSDEVFELLDARLALLLADPTYQFLIGIQGNLQVQTTDLLLRSDYTTIVKNQFSDFMRDFLKDLKNFIPVAKQSDSLLAMNQTALNAIVSEIGQAVNLVMPPIKSFSGPQFIQKIDDLVRKIGNGLTLQSAQGHYRAKVQILGPNGALDRYLASSKLESIKSAFAPGTGLGNANDAYTSILGDIWETIKTEATAPDFASNEALASLSKYVNLFTLSVPYKGDSTVTLEYTPYTESSIDSDGDRVPFVNFRAGQIADTADELARTALSAVKYKYKGSNSAEASKRKAEVATGLLKFVQPELQKIEDLTPLKTAISNLAVYLEKETALSDVFKKCAHILHQLSRHSDTNELQVKIQECLVKLGEPREALGLIRDIPNFASTNIGFLFNDPARLSKAEILLSLACMLYNFVAEYRINIYFDLRFAVIVNVLMYQFVHEVVAMLMEPIQAASVKKVEQNRMQIDETRQQIFSLPQIKDYISQEAAKKAIIAQVARRVDPVMSGTFRFSPVVQAAIQTATSHMKTSVRGFDMNWQYFDPMPTITMPDTGFKSLFAEFVAKFILVVRKETGSGPIETLVSAKSSARLLRELLQRIQDYRPQPQLLADRLPPEFVPRK